MIKTEKVSVQCSLQKTIEAMIRTRTPNFKLLNYLTDRLGGKEARRPTHFS
jgi:hypothetical protein